MPSKSSPSALQLLSKWFRTCNLQCFQQIRQIATETPNCVKTIQNGTQKRPRWTPSALQEPPKWHQDALRVHPKALQAPPSSTWSSPSGLHRAPCGPCELWGLKSASKLPPKWLRICSEFASRSALVVLRMHRLTWRRRRRQRRTNTTATRCNKTTFEVTKQLSVSTVVLVCSSPCR